MSPTPAPQVPPPTNTGRRLCRRCSIPPALVYIVDCELHGAVRARDSPANVKLSFTFQKKKKKANPSPRATSPSPPAPAPSAADPPADALPAGPPVFAAAQTQGAADPPSTGLAPASPKETAHPPPPYDSSVGNATSSLHQTFDLEVCVPYLESLFVVDRSLQAWVKSSANHDPVLGVPYVDPTLFAALSPEELAMVTSTLTAALTSPPPAAVSAQGIDVEMQELNVLEDGAPDLFDIFTQDLHNQGPGPEDESTDDEGDTQTSPKKSSSSKAKNARPTAANPFHGIIDGAMRGGDEVCEYLPGSLTTSPH